MTDLERILAAFDNAGVDYSVSRQRRHSFETDIPLTTAVRIALGGPSELLFNSAGYYMGWSYMATDECSAFKARRRA
jgi:hypothetical protein